MVDFDFDLAAGSDDSEGPGISLFDESAEGVAGDPGGVWAFTQGPGVEEIEHPSGVVFGDVVEVVGDGFSDVKTRVSAEVLEDGEDGGGIGDEGIEPEGPGETWAASLTGEAADVVVVIAGPSLHDGESAWEVLTEEGTDGELGRAKGSKIFEGLEGEIEVLEAVLSNVIGKDETDEAVVDAGGEGAEDFDGGGVFAWKGRVKALGGTAEALHEGELVEISEGKLEEVFGVECWLEGRDLAGDVAEAGGIEPVFQGGGGRYFFSHGFRS